MSDKNPTFTRSSRNEIQPANRQTPSVRLNLKLGQLPNRKPLGKPYAKK